MKSVAEIRDFIKKNWLFNNESRYCLEENISYVFERVPKGEDVLFAFATGIAMWDTSAITLGSTTIFLLTDRHLLMGAAKTAWSTREGFEMIDVSQIKGIDFKHNPGQFHKGRPEMTINVDVGNIHVALEDKQYLFDGYDFGDKIVSKVLPIVNSLKENLKKEEMLARQPQFSVADEIMKFKQLLDMGVITQEEFDKKKTELLNKK